MLDGVTDPHNVGALLRTAESAGATGEVFRRNIGRESWPLIERRGRLYGSRESNPLHTSNQRAVSRTDRDTQPTTTVSPW